MKYQTTQPISAILSNVLSQVLGDLSGFQPSLSFSFLGGLSQYPFISPQGIALTFSRGGGAMQNYSDGQLDWAPENLARESNNPGTAPWGSAAVTVTDNAIYNPATGLVDAATQFETATTAIHQNGIPLPFSLPLNEYVTVEAEMAALGDRQGYIGSNAGAFGSNEFCYYDLINGTLGAVGSDVLDPDITPLGINPLDGKLWFMCRWTCRQSVSAAAPSIFFLSARTTDNARAPTFLGDVNKGIAVGRVNIRRGRHYGVYLPTTTNPQYGPAFDHNPGKMYVSGQNLYSYSEQLDNAAYSSPGATVTPNVSVNPFNSALTADKLVPTATSGTFRELFPTAPPSLVAGQLYTFSTYVKADGYNFIQFYGNSAQFGAGYINMDVTTGEITSNVPVNSVILDTGSEDAGNGLKRVWTTWRCTGSGVGRLSLGIIQTGTSFRGGSTWTPDGVSGVIVFGYQLNEGYLAPYTATIASPILTGTPIAPARGLAIWEGRPNIVPVSENYTNPAYAKTDTVPTANTTETLSPEGLFNATKLVEGSAGTAIVSIDTGTFTVGNRLISSNAIKRGNHDWVRIVIGDTTFTDRGNAWFNLATGQRGSQGVAGTALISDWGMIDIGGGWLLPWVDLTLAGVHTVARLGTCSATADNSTTRVSGAIRYQFYTQVETLTVVQANASTGRATSYIPTFGATATRGADVVGIDITNQAQWYNLAEGTIVASFEPSYINTNSAGRGIVYQFESGSSANSQRGFLNAGFGVAYMATTVGGTDVSAFASPVLVAGVVNRIAQAYKTNDFQAYFNGSNLGTDVSGAVPSSALTIIRIGNRTDSFGNGWYPGIEYYNARLPATAMGNFTK